MKCNREKCIKSGDPGLLIKVGNYYVCTKCCSDTFSFQEITELGDAEARNCFVTKPKGKSIQILRAEYRGYYKYKKTDGTKYIKYYKIFGRDEQPLGQIIFMDYSKSELITYKGPYIMLHISTGDYIETTSLEKEEVIFS